MATQQELLDQASEICNAEHEGENTAVRVGTMLLNIIEYMGQFMTSTQLEAALAQLATSIEEYLAGYATIDQDSGLLDLDQSWFVPLATMGALDDSPEEYTPATGEYFYQNRSGYQIFRATSGGGAVGKPAKIGVVYFNKRSGKSFRWDGSAMVELGKDSFKPHVIDYYTAPPFADISVGQSFFYTTQSGTRRLAVKTGTDTTWPFDPDPDCIYVFRDTKKTMIWNSSSRAWDQVGGSDSAPVNDLETGGEDKALSAEMGKRLKGQIGYVYERLQAVYGQLGNIAFWDGKPSANTILPDLDWGSPKHTVTLALSLTNAVVKHNGVAVADGGTILVEEGNTLTLIVEAASGYRLTSVTSSTAGATVADLGDGTYSVAIVMGGSNVTLNVAASAEGHYLSPENGELVFWLDGLDVKATDTSWADKISLGNSDEITLVPNGTIGQSTVMPDEENHCWKFADANIKTNGVFLTSNATRNYSPSLYTIEVVYKTTSFGGSAINRSKIISFARSAADDISPVIYYSARNAGSSGWIDGARIPSSSIENDCWALNNELNTPMVVGMNGDTAVSKGLILQTIGATHWSADSNITALGGTLDPNNGTTKTCMFAGNIYAVRVWSGKLTAAQMLHNQRVDNERYNLGLTLPESVQ